MANLIKFAYMKYKKINFDDISFFNNLLGNEFVYSDDASRAKYSHDETEDLKYFPELVLIPNNTNEVSKILDYCNSNLIPITPCGARTGLSGGSLPLFGGVALSLERFNSIIKIDERNLQVTVEPGVINQELRDAVEKKAKESVLLRKILDDFNPEFCFNLHDQRTIFGVEGTNNPATISFLAPSEEETRKVTKTRIKTMNIIVAMNALLQQIIPKHIGRYSDTFYPTATGDNFQKLGYSTVLIESGHYKDDYQREKVREFTFISILQGLYHIGLTTSFSEFNSYFKIPENNTSFRDVLKRHQNKPNEAFQFDAGV